VQHATERRRALELECEQARYAVQLAQRRYEAVDPDNRLSRQNSRPDGMLRSPIFARARHDSTNRP